MNKNRTSKVGAISKAQKAQNNFFEKNLKFLNFYFFQKKGPFGDIKKFSKKSRIVPKKSKGGFLEKVKNERGTLWTKFALALGGFRIVSKKWTDQCEDCSLKNKTGTSKVGAIYKAQKAQDFF